MSNEYETKRLDELKDMTTPALIKLLTQFAWWEKPHTIVHQTLIQAATALEAMEWQDISTGPKNNMRVLLLVPPYGPTTGNFNEGVWHYHSVLNAEAQPSHWMPLPAPPEEK